MKRNVSEKDSVHHALAIARWEDNYQFWLDGKYLGLYSKKKRLQEIVKEGGTLWIIVSRQGAKGGRLYSLSFRLDNCSPVTLATPNEFGRYGVLGDPIKSTVFASNDARLLLLGMRFNPFNPINNQDVIGESIQTPRRLNSHDIRLLEDFAKVTDRWSVFISYQHDDVDMARKLSESLAKSGVHVFRDKEALFAGEQWWPALKRAIHRSRFFVILLGKNTHGSEWVNKELDTAVEKGTQIIPVLLREDWGPWADRQELTKRHALRLQPGGWASFMDQLLRSIGAPMMSTGE